MFIWIDVGKTINHPPVITIFIGGMVTISSHGWFMTLFFPQQWMNKLVKWIKMD